MFDNKVKINLIDVEVKQREKEIEIIVENQNFLQSNYLDLISLEINKCLILV